MGWIPSGGPRAGSLRSEDGVLASFPAFPPAACLVQALRDADGRFTARVLGEPDLQATAATTEEAVERLRGRLREGVNRGRLLAIELPRQDPLLERFGSAPCDFARAPGLVIEDGSD